MDNPILDGSSADAQALLESTEAQQLWELLRRKGKPLSRGQLQTLSGLAAGEVQRLVDMMVALGIVRTVKADRRRKSPAFRAVGSNIVVGYRDTDMSLVRRLWEIQSRARARFAEISDRLVDPELLSRRGMRYAYHGIEQLSKDDIRELQRHLMEITEIFRRPVDRRREARHPNGVLFSQAVSIRVEPLLEPVLPLPEVWVAPHSKLGEDSRMRRVSAPKTELSAREREVVQMLVDGAKRKQIAHRMGLTLNTINTLAARAYRKLGVRTQVQLISRFDSRPSREAAGHLGKGDRLRIDRSPARTRPNDPSGHDPDQSP
jgi:DNA-binding CsgD family transcriptional regulator